MNSVPHRWCSADLRSVWRASNLEAMPYWQTPRSFAVTFDAFAQQHPELYKSLVTLLATRLRETDLVIAAGSFLPLKGRVATTLLELAENFGQDVGAGRIVIRQKIGQSDLAAMAGIARENVSRILNDWKRRKLVSRLSGYYCLENKAQLQTEAEL